MIVGVAAIVRGDPTSVRENTEPSANKPLPEVEVVRDFPPRRRFLTVEALE
ncbi:hypothetical protein [Halorubrum distributum]|uniref:hypothetical protein n=1 Tax=Halorubrum distributum TaxID=29283 RepID=UPI000B04FA43|nr:hypothetical protein [Halorubrum terrestre]